MQQKKFAQQKFSTFPKNTASQHRTPSKPNLLAFPTHSKRSSQISRSILTEYLTNHQNNLPTPSKISSLNCQKPAQSQNSKEHSNISLYKTQSSFMIAREENGRKIKKAKFLSTEFAEIGQDLQQENIRIKTFLTNFCLKNLDNKGRSQGFGKKNSISKILAEQKALITGLGRGKSGWR